MERRDALLLDAAPVRERRIPRVVLPAVVGIAGRKTFHETVPDDLRHDRGGRDRVAARVAVHDRGVRADEVLEPVHPQAVDEHVLPLAHAADGTAHGEVRGVVDVDPVDLGHAGGAEPDGDRAAHDLGVEPLALRPREHLRVADTGDAASVGRHHDGRGEDRAAQAGDADGIGTHHHRATGAPMRALDPR